MSRLWMLIAHDEEARILEADALEGPWAPRARLHAPARHLPRGRPLDPHHAASGDDIDVAARPSVHDRGDERFAASIAKALLDGDEHCAFDRLVLAAPAHVMGVLRRILPERVQSKIVATLDGARVGDDPRAIVASAGLS